MKYKLNVMDRLMLNQVLPEKGSFASLRSIKEARKNVLLNDKEVEEFEFKFENDAFKWNEKGNEKRPIEIGEIAAEEVKKILKSMDEKKELSLNHEGIYEIFVEGKKEDK